MKAMLYISFLLFGLQFHCYQLSGPRDVQDNHWNTHSAKELQFSTLEQECETGVTALHKIVPYNAEFAFLFYKQMSSESDDNNILFSPVSMSTAFAMLTLGARSRTQAQIYRALAFNLSEIEENEIHKGYCQLIHKLNSPRLKMLAKIGHALFLDDSLRVLPTFLENVRSLYHTEAFSTNFLKNIEAKQHINYYLKDRTDRKTGHIVNDFSTRTLMVLVNYISFKDSWKDMFHSRSTVEKSFFAYGNTTVKLNFMHQHTHLKVLHDEDLSCWVVELPYSGDAVAWFILPDQGKLKDVESSLVKEDMNKWRASFQYTEIELWIPKFSLSASYDVKPFFQRLGLTDAFNRHADLSGISRKRKLRVSGALHEAVLIVHEDRTMFGDVGIPGFPNQPQHLPIFIEFNRPFLMFIIDMSTGTIFLMAKIVNPTKE